MREVIIGSRGSRLALWQAHRIGDLLKEAHPGLHTRIEVVRTSGDRLSDREAAQTVDLKGLFVKEIEEALLDRRVDLAVHSLKDLPGELPDGLMIAAVPRRADPRDALVCRGSCASWRDLPARAKILTGSLRRTVQLKALRVDLRVEGIRGNVDTRLRKLDAGSGDALVLAAAGLQRLGLDHRISSFFSVEEMIPAVGQGALAVEIRRGDSDVERMVDPLRHHDTEVCVAAERTFLARMGGGCQVPMGGHARLEDNRARFDAFVADPEHCRIIKQSRHVERSGLAEAALRAAEDLLEKGGERILRKLKQA